MEEALLLKFQQHADLCAKLIGTGNVHIIYADPNDAFWGSGPDGMGKNLLAQALVSVRETLNAQNMSLRSE